MLDLEQLRGGDVFQLGVHFMFLEEENSRVRAFNRALYLFLPAHRWREGGRIYVVFVFRVRIRVVIRL